MRFGGRPRREQVLTALWTPQRDVVVSAYDLPDVWLTALDRLGRDLRVRQYGGEVKRIDWVAEYESDGGYVFLLSDVTVAGHAPRGLGVSGCGARVDDDEETVLVSMADLVQDQVARAGVAWPWGDTGGFLTPRLIDGVAVWRKGERLTRIGDLRPIDP